MRKSVSVLSASPEATHSHRLQQLASLLRAEVGALITRAVELPPGVVVTVSGVKVLADLSEARVALSVLPPEQGEYTLAAVLRSRHEFHRVLGKRLKLYRIPKLEFYLDHTAERADKIEHLLDEIVPSLKGTSGVNPEETRRVDTPPTKE